MNRHERLYRQGIDAIERKRDLTAYIEEERRADELRDCIFQPTFFTSSPRVSSTAPKLYSQSVNRLRKGVAMSMPTCLPEHHLI